MTSIAVLGLGAMGARMAARLVDPTVYNRHPERAAPLVARGARLAATPAEAVADADLVISMVTDDAAAEAIWLDPEHGAAAALRPGALALECSTTTPGWIDRLGAAVDARGARLLDAPVAGSTPQAEAGALVFLVGGAADDVERATPVMQRLGARALHVGPRGHGATFKLVVNALFGAQVALMAELLRLVEGRGLDVARALDLLAAMPVTSAAAGGAARLMLAGDHAPQFPVELVAKDLRYAESLAPLPVVAAARARFEAAVEAGAGGENLTAVHRAAPGRAEVV